MGTATVERRPIVGRTASARRQGVSDDLVANSCRSERRRRRRMERLLCMVGISCDA